MPDKNRSDEQREEEFLALFARCQRGLHAYILALVVDVNHAADILQETNIVLWKKFDQFEPGTNFFAWAREIARLSVLRHRQSSAHRVLSLDPVEIEQIAVSFSDQVDNQSTHQAAALRECLGKLSTSDRELIAARYSAGACVADLADRLGRSANSVSQSLCRIRRALVDCTQRRLRALSAY